MSSRRPGLWRVRWPMLAALAAVLTTQCSADGAGGGHNLAKSSRTPLLHEASSGAQGGADLLERDELLDRLLKAGREIGELALLRHVVAHVEAVRQDGPTGTEHARALNSGPVVSSPSRGLAVTTVAPTAATEDSTRDTCIRKCLETTESADIDVSEKMTTDTWFLLGLAASSILLTLGLLIAGICIINVLRRREKDARRKLQLRVLPQPPDLKTIALQTLPQVSVELERGSQVPLDLICCIDSSVSVGPDGFQKSASFMRDLITQLEFPQSKVGIVRFNHTFSVVSHLSSSLEDLVDSLKGMTYQHGETKLAPPLLWAMSMLQVGEYAQGQQIDERRKVVLVLTDGEPNDIPETKCAADMLKNAGVQLVFVQVSPQLTQLFHSLASSPVEKNAFQVPRHHDLQEVTTDVLRNIVNVSLRVCRAKCSVDMSTYMEVGDLRRSPGYDMMVPGWEAHGGNCWVWDPIKNRYIEDRIMPWEPQDAKPVSTVNIVTNHDESMHDVIRTVKPSNELVVLNGAHTSSNDVVVLNRSHTAASNELVVLNDSYGGPVRVVRTFTSIGSQVETQTDEILTLDRGLQTEALPPVRVYAELSQGTQAPLDLVCLVDSSVSVGEKDFGKARLFLEQLLQELDVPPVQMGIIRFNHRFSVISSLSPNRDEILGSLKDMIFEPGETKLGPPLNQAADMLRESRPRSESREQAVLVVTDGDPNDLAETEEAAAALKEAGVVVMFIHVGDLVDAQIMHRLASQPTSKYVIKSKTYDDLFDATGHVLRSVVKLSQWVRRAKVSTDLVPYQVVPDISKISGLEVLVPGWEACGAGGWRWEPRKEVCVEDAATIPWDSTLARGNAPPPPALAPAPPPNKVSNVQISDPVSNDLNITPWDAAARAPVNTITVPMQPDFGSIDAVPKPGDDSWPAQQDNLLNNTWPLNNNRVPALQRNLSAGHTAVSESYEDMIKWLRVELIKQYGDITSAFVYIDDNGTKAITVNKLVRGLSTLGISRRVAEAIFKRLAQRARCEQRGLLQLQDWQIAFADHQIAFADHPGGEDRRLENRLLASLNSVMEASRTTAGEMERTNGSEIFNDTSHSEPAFALPRMTPTRAGRSVSPLRSGSPPIPIGIVGARAPEVADNAMGM